MSFESYHIITINTTFLHYYYYYYAKYAMTYLAVFSFLSLILPSRRRTWNDYIASIQKISGVTFAAAANNFNTDTRSSAGSGTELDPQA